MDITEETIRYCITKILELRLKDLENLNKFISKGLIDRLNHLKDVEYVRLSYADVVKEINNEDEHKMEMLNYGDDLSSEHENYLTNKHGPIFVTHWPSDIKSFYMKQCDDNTCECFDFLMPNIGELVGASQREDDYTKLANAMDRKNVNKEDLSFYLDMRKYGTCPHGGFGLGFERLLMLVTGMQNIKDVIPFPVYHKNCCY